MANGAETVSNRQITNRYLNEPKEQKLRPVKKPARTQIELRCHMGGILNILYLILYLN